jgi:hypothetical protein
MSSPFSLFLSGSFDHVITRTGRFPFFHQFNWIIKMLKNKKKENKSQKEDFFKYKQLTSGRGISSSFPKIYNTDSGAFSEKKKKEKVVSGRLVCLFSRLTRPALFTSTGPPLALIALFYAVNGSRDRDSVGF